MLSYHALPAVTTVVLYWFYAMKELNGRQLAGYIKERQAREVRSLRQGRGIKPKLAIVSTRPHPASQLYMKLKQDYGRDIGVAVEIREVEAAATLQTIKQLNQDDSVHGIIVQLPLAEGLAIDTVVNTVAAGKDVDGLGRNAAFDPATPLAILWLLDGYNVSLPGKKIVLVGKGRLVGSPLARLLQKSDLNPTIADSRTKDLRGLVLSADIVITATGRPGLIDSTMLKENCVIVDAGVAEIDGSLKGDLADDVYGRDDLILTPKKGGVGPLTVAALFENTIRAAKGAADVADH